jgi:hypothetical protein
LKGKRRNNIDDQREQKRENEGLSQTSHGDLWIVRFLASISLQTGREVWAGTHVSLATNQSSGNWQKTETDEIEKIER